MTSPAIAHDILHLVGYCVPPDVLKVLKPEAVEKAVDWAGREHAHASDNVVRRLRRPVWLMFFRAPDGKGGRQGIFDVAGCQEAAP